MVCGLLLLGCSAGARAEVEYVISGVDDPLRQNVLNHVDVVQFGRRSRLSNRDLDEILDSTIDQARIALRPYGYYSPEIAGRYFRRDAEKPVLELTIDRGPPIVIRELELAIVGPGAVRREFENWRRQWPLEVGARLDQVAWEREKQRGIEIAEATGYLSAAFKVSSLELDLDNNTAQVRLVLDTGTRFVMGEIDYGEHVLAPGVVESVPRFEIGDPYSAKLMDDFRVDLWKTGYFTDVEVLEDVHTDANPPRVDLRVRTATDTRSSYQGALGFGTDTGFRLSGTYSRHPMSARGDRIDIGIGLQEVNDEATLRVTYRLPRRKRSREFWVPDFTFRFENQDLEFKRNDEDVDFIRLANGDVDERHLRFGRLKVYNRKSGEQQLFATPFVQYINSQRRYKLIEPFPSVADAEDSSAFDRLLNGVDNAISIGGDVDIVSVIGKQFQTRGHRERAWMFAAFEGYGSDVDFAQVYLSTRRSYIYGDRFKLLLRGEVGYTEAEVEEVNIQVGNEPLQLSVTRLPNFYRFKAGGSASVRGYGFEQLSNNNVGSNNILTASAEMEIKVLQNWSGAVFADIGNAFNDWRDPDLKLGVGFGIRWYSIAGPIRVDIAQAVDFKGRPWRLHFTIGTPLL